MTHYSEKRKNEDYDCHSKPQEGCGHVLAAHLRFFFGKALHTHHVEISVEKLQLLEPSELTKESEGRDCRYIQSQNPSCYALINLISVASKSS